MKSFSTYLTLKDKLTISQFIQSLFQVYGIEYQNEEDHQKRIENHCYDIYQYPEKGSVVVHLYHRMEYIYNEKEGGLCIHNDGYQKGYRYIDELLLDHLIKDEGIPLGNQPIKICHENCQQIRHMLHIGRMFFPQWVGTDTLHLLSVIQKFFYFFKSLCNSTSGTMPKTCYINLTITIHKK